MRSAPAVAASPFPDATHRPRHRLAPRIATAIVAVAILTLLGCSSHRSGSGLPVSTPTSAPLSEPGSVQPTNASSDRSAGKASSLVDAARIGAGWQRRTASATEITEADRQFAAACPDVAAMFSAARRGRVRSIYRLRGAPLPQVVVDRGAAASVANADAVRRVAASTSYIECLRQRMSSDPVALHDMTIRKLELGANRPVVGYLVRGVHGNDASSELVLIDVVVRVVRDRVDVVTISSSGRFPVDAAVRDAVVNALGAS